MKRELCRFDKRSAKLHCSYRKFIFIYALDLYMQQERDRLLAEVENLAANSDGQTHKSEDIHAQKLKALEGQVRIPIFCLNLFFLLYHLNWNNSDIGKIFSKYMNVRFWI